MTHFNGSRGLIHLIFDSFELHSEHDVDCECLDMFGVMSAAAFRQHCEELQRAESRRREQELHVEQRALVKMRQELLRAEQQKDRMFHEMWEADVRAKEEREAQRVQEQHQRDMEQLDILTSQMEAAQQQRQKLKELKEENGSLRVCTLYFCT